MLLFIGFACSDEEPQPQNPIEVADFETTIDENPDDGQVLGTITASNTSGTVSYALSNEVPEGAFSINSSGELIVADRALFNFEVNPMLTAEVTVSDDVSNGKATITVSLNDVDESSQYTIWDGSDITFTKADATDPTIEENQDRLTDNVWITRGTSGGQIYNIKVESEFNKANSPSGTKWAVGSIDNIEALEFKLFRDAVGSPKSVVGKDLVLYLELDDVYLPVKFTSWSEGEPNKGGFSYTRATEPN